MTDGVPQYPPVYQPIGAAASNRESLQGQITALGLAVSALNGLLANISNANLVALKAFLPTLPTWSDTDPVLAIVQSNVELKMPALPTDGETITIGPADDPIIYRFREVLGPGQAANATLTGTGQPSDGDSVTIGALTYVFKTTAISPYHVKIGTTYDDTLVNLMKAVNLAGTGDGAEYFAGTGEGAMVEHPLVSASDVAAHAIKFTAKEVGIAGNDIVSTVSNGFTEFSFGDEKFGGGIDSQAANDILIEATLADTLTNVKDTIEGYKDGKNGTGTVKNEYVTAETQEDKIVFTAVSGLRGPLGDEILVSSSMIGDGNKFDAPHLYNGAYVTPGAKGKILMTNTGIWVATELNKIENDTAAWSQLQYFGG